jgi:L-iditol 2-dehydrogenase
MRLPEMMRAAVVVAPGKMETRKVMMPEADGGLIIRVLACGVCGSDRRQFLGSSGNGRIIGHEVAGEIVQAPETQTRLEGSRVVVAPRMACGECGPCRRGLVNLCRRVETLGYQIPGGFAEYVRLPGRSLENGNIIAIPENLPPITATLAEPLSCVMNGIGLSAPRRDSSVLIFGAGPMGQMFLRMLKGRVREVRVVEPDPSRREFALGHGAEAALEPGSSLIPEAEVVIVACSSPRAYEAALGRVAPGGKVNLFGGLAKGIPIDSNAVHYGQLTIHGTSGSTPGQVSRAVEVLGEDPGFSEIITGVVGFDGLPEALSGKETGRGLELKTVLDPGL